MYNLSITVFSKAPLAIAQSQPQKTRRMRVRVNLYQARDIRRPPGDTPSRQDPAKLVGVATFGFATRATASVKGLVATSVESWRKKKM